MTDPDSATTTLRLAKLAGRLARCPDLDTLVETALASLSELFGYEHSLLLLLDESGERLFTIASHGYAAEGVGSEVRVGEGVIGMVADRAESMRVGNLRQMLAYGRSVRRAYEERGGEAPGREIPLPGLADGREPGRGARHGVGAARRGRRDRERGAGSRSVEDEALLAVVATLVASAIEIDWAHERAVADPSTGAPAAAGRTPVPPVAESTAGAVLRRRRQHLPRRRLPHQGRRGPGALGAARPPPVEGRTEFTNKEVRLDPALELPEFRDNLESRLILLKRRLDEREAPLRIEKTGRGRFRLVVEHDVRLECVEVDE